MDLSIIIGSFNTKDLTLNCMESITKSKPKLKYEVIVVDNGSKDGSVEEIKGYKKNNPRYKIRIIRNKDNLGFSKANNQGINVAKGRYILLLNSDTLVKGQALDELVGFAKKTSGAGVVGARLLNDDKSIQKSVFNFPTISGAINQYWIGKNKELDKYAPEGIKAVEVDAVVGAAFLITPKALEEVGDLDERYFMFYEDLDYCRRVKDVGLTTFYLPSSEIIHLHGGSGNVLADSSNQWKRLIPSSKIYHGLARHCIFNFVLWSGQKFLGHK